MNQSIRSDGCVVKVSNLLSCFVQFIDYISNTTTYLREETPYPQTSYWEKEKEWHYNFNDISKNNRRQENS